MVDRTTSITKSLLYPRRRTKDRPMDMRIIRLLVLPLGRLYLRWIAVREAADITFSMSTSLTLTYIKAATFIRRTMGPKHCLLPMVSNLAARSRKPQFRLSLCRAKHRYINLAATPSPVFNGLLYPKTDTVIVFSVQRYI